MVKRLSALTGHYEVGCFGRLHTQEPVGVVLQEVTGLTLSQVSAWPESINDVGKKLANLISVTQAPDPCRACTMNKATLLRVEPLTWWLVGVSAPTLQPEQGSCLDLSHSRTHVRISGVESTSLLNRHLSIDLRESAFPVNSLASTVMHHVSVTLWRSTSGYELLIPRGYAVSLWQGLTESAAQFGVEVLAMENSTDLHSG